MRFVIHRVDRMDPAERDALFARLLPVHARSTGVRVDPERFYSYLFAPAVRHRLGEVSDDSGQTLAFCTFALHAVTVGDRTWGLYRPAGFATPGVGFQPYMARLALHCCLVDQLRWPTRSFACVGHIVQPLPYAFFRRYAPRTYPTETRATPAAIEAVRDAAMARFDEEVVRPPWVVRAFARHGRPFRPVGDAPLVAEFERLVPDWREGHALFYVMPLDLGALTHGALQMVRDVVARALRTPRRLGPRLSSRDGR